MEKDTKKNTKQDYLQHFLDSQIIDAQADDENLMPFMETEVCNSKDTSGSPPDLEILLNLEPTSCDSNGSIK